MCDVKPWETEEGKVIWKTEAQYWQWIRGAMRRIWADYPLRKEWKSRQLRPVTQEEKDAKLYHPSTKKVGQCSFCGNWMAGSKLEVDHIECSTGCTSKQTAEEFLWHCGGRLGEDFQLACKPCHKIKSHAERKGISFEEAYVEKYYIAWSKHYSVEDQKKFITQWGFDDSCLKNAASRKRVALKYFKELFDKGELV